VLAASCGIAGVLMLAAHFVTHSSVPAATRPLPHRGVRARHHGSILISARLQVTSATLHIVFILAIVHLAYALGRFGGRIASLAGAHWSG
jgi:hypothetical protein